MQVVCIPRSNYAVVHVIAAVNMHGKFISLTKKRQNSERHGKFTTQRFLSLTTYPNCHLSVVGVCFAGVLGFDGGRDDGGGGGGGGGLDDGESLKRWKFRLVRGFV